MKISKSIYSIWSTQKNYNFVQIYASAFERKHVYHSWKYYSTNLEDFKEYETPIENIRNFSIIAHVDHGKSTLADRLLELTGAVKLNSGKQILDSLQVEKDRGITVKAQTASLDYTYKGTKYLLNLIDTPGHVDFSAEVYRSLVPCQGVILVVDANDGVQAQTVANYYLAIKQKLTIIPVINKIDLKHANPNRVIKQLETLFDIKEEDVLKISAKLGTGVHNVLDAVVERLPPPNVFRNKPFRALTFDSWYNKYKGAISLVYITEGSLSVGQQITSTHTKKSYDIKTLSLLRPDEESVNRLFAGQIGCIACNMRSSQEAFIGDTLHLKNQPVELLLKFKTPKPMVFSGVYPVDQSQFESMKTAIEKLTLNDSAVSVAKDSSVALGQGWRIGFLGLLHMEVFMQRLEQEFGAQPITTIPNVTYKAEIFGAKNIKKYGSNLITFNNPTHFPHVQIVTKYYEPLVLGTIITPEEYIGEIISLCREKRGIEQSTTSIGTGRIMMRFILPLNEIIVDFHDSLKCLTSGYASFDYEEHDYEPSNIVKLDIALNGTKVEEISTIVHNTKANATGKQLCEKLKEIIPRQLYEIVIQAMVGEKVLAREVIKPFRKDVTAKLYGGDVSRRKKLLAKQAEGKKRMKMIGKISIPRDTFIKVLKR
ncbi:PREDICTED: translation factor Guf1, mitochondrial [Dufourea novaeangliae]|uniref:Translation factor GUF1 homolog, mitochondrial n=1 Tax=Dufourea novaeangliae TaxID=178035 RepID=A0A154NYF9_DUFNO|nr:PREDICTED: translation factor Guf1, mitochondrial [Dufourea novaeangliae]KZC04058.1 Translation factor waclaw, mitochondrial [Dufourea novaeangliae]